MSADALDTVSADAGERPWRLALRRLVRRRAALIGLAVVVLFVALAVAAPIVAPYDPLATDWRAVRKPPSAHHLFGTDELGRDVLARVIWGARASLMAGLVSVSIALAVAVPLGLVSGYLGGLVDGLVMRIIDAMLAIPFLILAIALAAFLGPNLSNAMIAIGVVQTPIFTRLTRGQVLAVKHEDYIEAARAVGNPHRRILLRHILPNILAPIVVQATLAIAAAVIAEASLSFLGLGQQPPTPSWGSMLNTASHFLSQAPWMAMWPGLAIFSLVLSFNVFGRRVARRARSAPELASPCSPGCRTERSSGGGRFSPTLPPALSERAYAGSIGIAVRSPADGVVGAAGVGLDRRDRESRASADAARYDDLAVNRCCRGDQPVSVRSA
jgi:peptide/nickel transport system permease protein